MSREALLKQLENIIKNELKVEGLDELRENMTLLDDLAIDSIMMLQLIVYIEEDMNLIVPAENIDSAVFKTVGSLLCFIEGLQPKGAEV